jgi:hypothetical protein
MESTERRLLIKQPGAVTLVRSGCLVCSDAPVQTGVPVILTVPFFVVLKSLSIVTVYKYHGLSLKLSYWADIYKKDRQALGLRERFSAM